MIESATPISRLDFNVLIRSLTDSITGKSLDAALAIDLNERYGPSSLLYTSIVNVCKRAIDDGWMCSREANGIRYGRVVKPTVATRGFSVDVVDMRDVVGPHHRHPNGEIDLVIPLDGNACFDGHGAGWVVYGSGSGHSPTVSGGRALVLYLLPEGAIEFTAAAKL